MLRSFLFIFLFSFKSLAVTIVEVENKSDIENYFEEVSEVLSKDKVKTTVDLREYQKLGLSLKIDSSPLDKKKLAHDIDKLYLATSNDARALSDWSKFESIASLNIPLALELPLPGLPISFNIFNARTHQTKLSIELPKYSARKLEDDGFFKGISKNLANKLRGSRAIDVSLEIDDLLKKYPIGSQLSQEGIKNVVTGGGVTLRSKVALSANIKHYLSTTAVFKTTVKRLYDESNQKLIQLEIEKKDAKGNEKKFGLDFGTTIFETSSVKGDLNVELISFIKSKSNSSNFKFKYIIDLGKKTAQEAYNRALKGDLTLLQERGRYRHERKEASGILKLEERNDEIERISQSFKLGPSFAKTEIDFSLTSLDVGDKKALISSVQSQNQITTQSSSRDYSGVLTEEINYEYKFEKESDLFFGLLKSSSSQAKIKSTLSDLKIVNENGSELNTKVNKVTGQFKISHLKSKRNITQFLDLVESTIRGNTNYTALAQSIREKNSCEGQSTFELNFTLFDRAISKILNYNERELWVVAAKTLGFKLPVKFRYQKTRNKAFKKLIRERRSISNKRRSITGLTRDEKKRYKEIRKTIRLFRYFEDLIPTLSKQRISTYEDKKRTAQVIKELFTKSDKDITKFLALSEYLIRLNSDDDDQNEQTAGVFLNYKFKSENCNFNWKLASDKIFLH